MDACEEIFHFCSRKADYYKKGLSEQRQRAVEEELVSFCINRFFMNCSIFKVPDCVKIPKKTDRLVLCIGLSKMAFCLNMGMKAFFA